MQFKDSQTRHQKVKKKTFTNKNEIKRKKEANKGLFIPQRKKKRTFKKTTTKTTSLLACLFLLKLAIFF